MKKILLIFIGVIFSCLIGCEDDNKGMEWSDEPIRLSGQVLGMNENEVQTRFRGGAGVGIYIADAGDESSGNLLNARVSNKKFMQSADGLVGDPLVYWKEKSRIEIAAYYPYLQETGNVLNACLFQVAEHQGVSVNGLLSYQESDFLWARGRADFQTEPVLLEFKHLMSKVVIYLKSDAMIPGDMVGSEVSILGMATKAKIDLEEGVVVAEGEPVAIVAAEENMQKDGFEIAVKAIVVPQIVKKGTTWLNIKTLGGYSYTYELPEDWAFLSGKQVTVDVSVESGECYVTVGEIEDWTESGNLVVGEAVEDLPVFELYDFYNLNGVQGLVIAVDETGKHGTLISLDETLTQWCTEPSLLMAEAYSEDDAQENLNEILKVDPTLEKFPAMKWCMDRNKDGVSGWYMPASNELRDFWKVLYENTDFINDKIVATGVVGATIIKTDYWDTNGYFSSTLSFSDRVESLSFSLFGGVNVSLLSQDAWGDVRAFYKF
mgnify:FL=1